MSFDIEFLLQQWGLWSIGGLGLGLQRGAEAATIICEERDIEKIDWAIGQIGLKNPRRKNILKHKYLSKELDEHGYSIPISDAMVALRFRTSESDIQNQIRLAVSDINDLLSAGGSVERRWFR